jgi:hypothetical protein
MNYITEKCGGELRLTDYEQSDVRFCMADNPYGLTTTDFAQAKTDMGIMANALAGVSGMTIIGLEFFIELTIEPETGKPETGSDGQWTGLLSCESVDLLPRVFEIVSPLQSLWVGNQLDHSQADLIAYNKLFTLLSEANGGSCCTLRGGELIQVDGSNLPLIDASLKVYQAKK